MIWDDENQLVGVAYPDATVETHTYGAEGLRRKKETSSATSLYIWDEGNLLQETDGSGVTQAHYTDAPGSWGM